MDKIMQLGLEIVASMKANIYHNGDMELGRIDALNGTEPEHYGKHKHAKYAAEMEKKRLYEQAYFSAKILIEKLKELGVDVTPLEMRPCNACQGGGCPPCNGMGQISI